MKFLIKTLSLLLILLFSLKLIIHIFDDGHQISYSVGNFTVEETLTVDSLDKIDNYYFEITHENININFQIYNDYNKDEKIITNIKYYEDDNYSCILPIFKNDEILTDIMCLSNDTITYYHDIENKSDDLISFASSIKGYDINNYTDNSKAEKITNTLSIYKDNILENHYIAMETYTGLMLLNTEETVNLFENDVYKKPISTFTDKYYIVANYNEEHNFKIFYVVNLINGNIIEIRSYNQLSFDSIIEGTIDNETYFFDPDSQTQYKIVLEGESVETVANKDNLKDYQSKWTTMTLSDAINGKKFNPYYSDDISGYTKVDKVGNKEGYYYLYEEDKQQYKVYRVDVQNQKIKTYLFTTTDIDSVIYLDNYIYYVNGNTLYCYSNSSKAIATNTEIEFNDDISFGVYIK